MIASTLSSFLRVRAPLALMVLASAFVSTAAAGDEDQPAPQDAPTWRLAYQFSPGEKTHYHVTHSARIDVRYGEVAVRVEHAANSHQHLLVKGVDAQGIAVVESTIDAAIMAARQDGETHTYDSRDGAPGDNAFAALHGTIGKPLARLKMRDDGLVLDLSAGDGRALEGGQTDAESRFDVPPRLPSEPVAIGDTWTDEFEVDVQSAPDQPRLKRSIVLHRIYKLAAVDGPRATIEQRTIVVTPIRDPFLQGQLVQRTPGGTLVFDMEQGRLVSRELVIEEEVVGFNGEQSILTVASRHTETLAPNGQVELTPPALADAR